MKIFATFSKRLRLRLYEDSVQLVPVIPIIALFEWMRVYANELREFQPEAL